MCLLALDWFAPISLCNLYCTHFSQFSSEFESIQGHELELLWRLELDYNNIMRVQDTHIQNKQYIFLDCHGAYTLVCPSGPSVEVNEYTKLRNNLYTFRTNIKIFHSLEDHFSRNNKDILQSEGLLCWACLTSYLPPIQYRTQPQWKAIWPGQSPVASLVFLFICRF